MATSFSLSVIVQPPTTRHARTAQLRRQVHVVRHCISWHLQILSVCGLTSPDLVIITLQMSHEICNFHCKHFQKGGPKLWRGGGEMMKFKWTISDLFPKYLGGYFPMSKIAPPNGSCAQDAAGVAVADQCRHLLIFLAVFSWWAPVATFAWFCFLIVLFFLFLQLFRRHAGTAFFISMAEELYWRQNLGPPLKMAQNQLKLGGGVLMVQIPPEINIKLISAKKIFILVSLLKTFVFFNIYDSEQK